MVALGAVVLAGAAGTGSSAGEGPEASTTAIQAPSAGGGDAPHRERTAELSETSRDHIRTSLAEIRDHEGAPDTDRTGSRTAQAASLLPEDPREIAREMMAADYGWDSTEFSCLDQLYISESAWEVDAENPTSGAYGIPQSLPPEKMASAGSDWRTNPATQLEWGLWYIDQSYGTPCSAWEFKQANNWY